MENEIIIVEISKDFWDWFFYFAPFLVLFFSWIGIWVSRKRSAQYSTKMRLKAANKWLKELKNDLAQHTDQVTKLKDQLSNIEVEFYHYTFPSFPISEIQEMDFESNFVSFVQNIKTPESSINVYFNFRKIIRLLNRHTFVLDREIKRFEDEYVKMREHTNSSHKIYIDELERISSLLIDGNRIQPDEIEKIIISDMKKKKSLKDLVEMAEHICICSTRLSDTEKFKILVNSAKSFLNDYRGLKIVHESIEMSLSKMLEKLNSIQELTNSVLSNYSNAKPKMWLNINSHK